MFKLVLQKTHIKFYLFCNLENDKFYDLAFIMVTHNLVWIFIRTPTGLYFKEILTKVIL